MFLYENNKIYCFYSSKKKTLCATTYNKVAYVWNSFFWCSNYVAEDMIVMTSRNLAWDKVVSMNVFCCNIHLMFPDFTITMCIFLAAVFFSYGINDAENQDFFYVSSLLVWSQWNDGYFNKIQRRKNKFVVCKRKYNFYFSYFHRSNLYISFANYKCSKKESIKYEHQA